MVDDIPIDFLKDEFGIMSIIVLLEVHHNIIDFLKPELGCLKKCSILLNETENTLKIYVNSSSKALKYGVESIQETMTSQGTIWIYRPN